MDDTPDARPSVAMSPVDRAGNPYTSLLAAALRAEQLAVTEYRPSMRRPAARIVHVHWPEQLLFGGTTTRTAVKSARLLAALHRARAAGARVVWTAHNVQPHDHRREPVRERALDAFFSVVDGVVHLSRAGQTAVSAARPRLAGRPSVLVPHGDLSSAYPSVPRPEARRQLGLGAGERMVLVFGRIRAYRGVEEAVRVFVDAGLPDVHLHVVGPCGDEALVGRLRALTTDAPGVRLDLRLLTDLELATHLAAADLVLQPFVDVLHSGTVHLALGHGVPVLAPALGALPELREHVGLDLLRLYDGSLDAELLSLALSAPPTASAAGDALGTWGDIARLHAAFYEQLLDRSR